MRSRRKNQFKEVLDAKREAPARGANHWRKAQRSLPESPYLPEPPRRRERGPRTLDSLLAGRRRRAPWK